MDIIGKKDFVEAGKDLPDVKPEMKADFKKMTPADLKRMMGALDNPIESQKELAARIGHFLSNRLDKEVEDKGFPSATTHAWVKTYNEILDRIHRNTFGDKSTSLKIVVSHSDIANRLRKANKRNRNG